MDKRKKAHNLSVKMQEQAQVFKERDCYKKMAEKDPEMKKLLEELEELEK